MAGVLDRPDAARLLLRVAVAGMLLLHGIHKLRHGIDGIIANVERHHLPGFVGYGVIVGEVLAPLLVLVGWQPRLAALVIAFNMAMAIYLSHADQVIELGRAGGWSIELPALYLFGAVAVALLGPGRYSVSRGVGRFD